MNSILLLLDDEEVRRLVQDWLANRYEVIVADAEATWQQPPDLCIADPPSFHRFADWIRTRKNAERPAVLPLVLLASREDLGAISREAGYGIDELILYPLDQREFLVRLRALLRMRHFSLQLKASQEKLLRVGKAIESTSDAISIADVNGTAIYLNRAFVKLYQYTVNELNVRGIPNSLFVQPEVAHFIFSTVPDGYPWRGEVALKTKGGQLVPTLLQVDAIQDEAGSYLGLISVHTDITERKLAEAIQREQRILDEALRDTAVALPSTLDLDEVLDRILVNIGRVVPHDSAQIWLIDTNNSQAYVARSRSPGESLFRDHPNSEHHRILEAPELRQMAESGQPVIVSEVDPRQLEFRLSGQEGVRSYMGAPIRLKGATIGFLYLDSAEAGFFNPAHAERLQDFARQAAIAIQNAQLHKQAQELAILKERQRLAHDLHDAVSQTLFSASVIAEALPRLWRRKPETVKPRLDQLHRLTRGALAEMRTLLLELYPTRLAEADFNELLRQLTDALQGSTRIDVSLTVEGRRALPEEVQTALFYLAQEALNNVVKHARATRVTVHLRSEPERVELAIEDNGRGFDLAQIPSTSLGLGIMRERAAAIGASLQVTSAVGHGTTVTVVWVEECTRDGHE
jgi:PAS domain S-box-containing protein